MITNHVHELPVRLNTIVQLVTQAGCVADIGSDHGQVPLALLEQGRVERAIAVEVARGPFVMAETAFRKSQYHAQLEARFGDGLSPLQKGEVQGIVIAGMGAGTIWRILTAPYALQLLSDDLPELIVQPMEETGLIRFFARLTGYQVKQDVWIQDRGLIYNCLQLHPPDLFEFTYFDKELAMYNLMPWSERMELEYGMALYDSHDIIFNEYLTIQVQKTRYILSQIEQSQSMSAQEQRIRLNDYLGVLENIRTSNP